MLWYTAGDVSDSLGFLGSRNDKKNDDLYQTFIQVLGHKKGIVVKLEEL